MSDQTGSTPKVPRKCLMSDCYYIDIGTHTHTCTHTYVIYTANVSLIKLYTVMCNTGVAKEKDCVIVDDLVQTGGTLLECAKVLLSYDRTFSN